ncbi:MAG: serine hydrolase [Minisyncoccia bacterium]
MTFLRNEKLIIIVLFLLLIFSWLHHFKETKSSKHSCIRKYKYINFDLNCDEDPSVKTNELKDLVKKTIQSNIAFKKANRVSVFYRDLVNRQWFGINENDNFSPASLLKLPLAIAYFKLQEVDQTVLSKQLMYKDIADQGSVDIQNIKVDKKLDGDKLYPIQDLIEQMLQYSDNNALDILAKSMNENFQNKVYVDLGISYPISGDIADDFVSVKTYGVILRTLYNSSYLNQSLSNNVLEIMSGSKFKSGIASGVPSNIVVSNKFGERRVVDVVNGKSTKIELHDCGIIYDKDNPYILCVMTQGHSYEELENVIYDISKVIYQNR